MTKDEFNILLEELAIGWTTRDYRAVADHFAEKVFYCDPQNYTLRDRASLLAFFEDDDGKPQSCQFHGGVFDEAVQQGVAEYTYEGTFRYHGTVWIEFREDKIVSWREYQHRSEKDWKDFWKS
jgi:hypothetical protein